MGYFPKPWKEASIKLILKNGRDPKLTSSYRPINLISIPGKILDKLLNKNQLVFGRQKFLH